MPDANIWFDRSSYLVELAKDIIETHGEALHPLLKIIANPR